MALTFYYYFNDDSFEYEADYREAKDYIKQVRSSDEILQDFIDTGLYDKESESDKETLLEYDGFDGTYDSIENMSEDIKKELVDEILFDLIQETDQYEDELKDYFEQDAYDDYESEIAWEQEKRSLNSWIDRI